MARANSRSSTRAKPRKSSRRGKSSRARSTQSRTAQARSARTAARSSRRSRGGGNGASASRGNDAIALLKADHRQVEDWFEQFEKARSDDRKRSLATNICNALRMHTQIEEEIFYPAFYEATQEEDLHHEAIIEHDGAKRLIEEIESSGPEDEYYDARVKVLSEMIKHHVKEEEQRDGLFAKARSSRMDLVAIGERLAERKKELEGEPELLKSARQGKDAGKGLMSRLASAI